MASEGPLNAGSAVDDSAVGTGQWFNESNVYTSNNSNSVSFAATTYYLKCGTFGFAIPSGATIDGIVVEIEKSGSSASAVSDNRVRIVKGGTIGTTDKAAAGFWPTTDAYTTYGTSSDLWGESWTDTDINASGFGVAISATATGGAQSQIDHVRITVYYTAGGGGSPTNLNYIPAFLRARARRRNLYRR